MPKFVLIRHGESLWNGARRIQGNQDPPLSPRGLRQVDRLVARMQGHRPGRTAAVYTSPLRRAAETAERLAAALSQAAGQTYAANDLPFMDLALSANLNTVSFNVAGQGYSCATSGASCSKLPAPVPGLIERPRGPVAVSYTNLRAHENRGGIVWRLLLEKKKIKTVTTHAEYDKKCKQYLS